MKTVNKVALKPYQGGFMLVNYDPLDYYVYLPKRHFPYKYRRSNLFTYNLKYAEKRKKVISKYNHRSSWKYFYFTKLLIYSSSSLGIAAQYERERLYQKEQVENSK